MLHQIRDSIKKFFTRYFGLSTKKHQTHFVYIFVRKDLPPATQLVQACHAVAESAKHYFHNVSEHPHFVVLGVKDEPALLKTIQKFGSIRYKLFCEADLENQGTAIATEPIYSESDRRKFRSYQLLKPVEACV